MKKGYLIGQITIMDPKKYQQYASETEKIIKSFGSKVSTEIIASNIAIPVKIPKYIVGIKFDNTNIEKPNTIVIEVFNIAFPSYVFSSLGPHWRSVPPHWPKLRAN